jgi:hypothetical protein
MLKKHVNNFFKKIHFSDRNEHYAPAKPLLFQTATTSITLLQNHSPTTQKGNQPHAYTPHRIKHQNARQNKTPITAKTNHPRTRPPPPAALKQQTHSSSSPQPALKSPTHQNHHTPT